MLLLVAIVFLVAGGRLLSAELIPRVWGIRVTGTVVGVREPEGGIYYSVYRFSLPSGESIEATSYNGSSSARGRDTGRRVQLFTFADHPDEVCEVGIPVVGLFGAYFFAGGLLLSYVALTQPMTWLTGLVLAGVGAYVMYRARGMLIAKAQRRSPSDWFHEFLRGENHNEHEAEVVAGPVRRVEDLLAARRRLGLVTGVSLVFGAGAILLSVDIGRHMAHREAVAVRAPGTVVSVVESTNSDGVLYTPVVRFTDSDGVEMQFKDSFSSNPPAYQANDPVTVFYLRAAPRDSAAIDRGLLNWAPTVLLALLGVGNIYWALRS